MLCYRFFFFFLLDIRLLISLTVNTVSFQISQIHTERQNLLFPSPFIKGAYWFYLLYVDCFFCGARNTFTSQISQFCCVLAEEIILILLVLFWFSENSNLKNKDAFMDFHLRCGLKEFLHVIGSTSMGLRLQKIFEETTGMLLSQRCIDQLSCLNPDANLRWPGMFHGLFHCL